MSATDHEWELKRGTQVCVKCKTRARCLVCGGVLDWAIDMWICLKCGDEWPEESFDECAQPGPPDDEKIPCCGHCYRQTGESVPMVWNPDTEEFDCKERTP